MGKKSKRRSAPSKGGKRKGGGKTKDKGGSPKSVGGLGQAGLGHASSGLGEGARGYTLFDLMVQSELLRGNPYYCGDGSKWTDYDKHLICHQDEEPFYTDETDDELSERMGKIQLGEDAFNAKQGEANAKIHPEGSRDALKAALEKVMSDPAISNPYGIGPALGPKDHVKGEWVGWAEPMANAPEQVDQFWPEYEKDVAMHQVTMNKLSEEKRGGHRGSLDYILALNCVLQNTFGRLGLDFPPNLDLDQALSIRMNESEPLYKTRMEVWKAYEKLVAEMLRTVREHPLIPKPEPSDYDDDSIFPLEYRGDFPSAARRHEHDDEDEDDDKYDGLYGAACGFSGAEVEELMMQGIRPWDDDAHEVMAVLNGEYD